MNRVTTINLNGRAYQLEEGGENVLRKYLETAAAKLAGNPDKDEIMADFEQAIADKFDQKLNGHKNVVSEKEIEEIIAAMGPVEGEAAAGADGGASENSTGSAAAGSFAGSGSSGNPGAPKRLFRIPQGEWIMGVCTGLAAYFNIDLALVRILFVLITALSHGVGVIAYIILAIVMPPAKTEEEFWRAHGWTTRPPFNAHDFIEQAKMKYADLQKMHEEHKAQVAAARAAGVDVKEATKGSREEMKAWGKKMKAEMRAKKQQMKHEWRAHRYDYQYGYNGAMGGPNSSGPGDDFRYRQYGAGYNVSRGIYGFFAVIISLVLLAAGIVWAIGLAQVIAHGTFFGYALGAGQPLWVSIVFLCAAFYVVSLPFRLLLERAWGHVRYRSAWSEFSHVLVFLAVCAVLIYTGRELFPQVNEIWNNTLVALSVKH